MRQYEHTVNMAVIGQSNEQGVSDTDSYTVHGPFTADPIPPNGAAGSGYAYLVDWFAYYKATAVRFRNTAVGATSILEQWCGYTGTLGTDAVAKRPEDDGFDPNDYLANVWDAINRPSTNPDRRWVLVEGPGQRDDNLGTLATEFEDGLDSACRYLLDQDPSVHMTVGFTIYPQTLSGADLTRYQGMADAAWDVADALALVYPGRVFRGARGTDLWAYGSTPLKDTVHLQDAYVTQRMDHTIRYLLKTGLF